jgi:hypothetical protein
MVQTDNNKIQWKNIRMAPILHNRMEFAIEVRKAFEEFHPEHIVVEYPDTLKDKILEGVKRLPLLSVVYYEEEDGTFIYLPLEPTDGQVEAIRLALFNSIPIHFVDRDTEGYPLDFSPMPDPYAITRTGYFPYCNAFVKGNKNRSHSPKDILREKTMAHALQELSKTGERVLFVGGIFHISGILEYLEKPQVQVIGRRNRKGVGLAHLHLESSKEIMGEMPFLATAYERSRTTEQKPDRIEINSDLTETARKGYWKNSKEELSHNQIRIFQKFSRNYALLSGNLVPDLYQLIVAARGIADDNFAFEVWEKGTIYPWQTEEPGIPVLRLRGEDLFLDRKRIRFHRQMKTMRRRLVPVPVRKKRKDRDPEKWQNDFDGSSICSYPPEDVVIEGYGQYLKKKALQIKAEESVRIEPFTCSMLDGIDIRETIRGWTTKTLYVKAERPLKGKVGSVVVIFDPDMADDNHEENFPWCVTWLGEHSQESDMAFYSTPAGEVMEGPGISRCQYGGFMLTYPPLRVYDIWRDPFFSFARNKPEKLLLAALDYSVESHVVYVSATPPSGWCLSMAARLGKKIIFLPIGIFSPVTMKKIRQFHVLDGHPVRKYAREYI